MEFRRVQIYLLDVHVPRSKEKLKFAISRLIELCKEKKKHKSVMHVQNCPIFFIALFIF